MLNRRQTLGWIGAAGVSLKLGQHMPHRDTRTICTRRPSSSMRSVAPEKIYPAYPMMHR